MPPESTPLQSVQGCVEWDLIRHGHHCIFPPNQGQEEALCKLGQNAGMFQTVQQTSEYLEHVMLNDIAMISSITFLATGHQLKCNACYYITGL